MVTNKTRCLISINKTKSHKIVLIKLPHKSHNLSAYRSELNLKQANKKPDKPMEIWQWRREKNIYVHKVCT